VTSVARHRQVGYATSPRIRLLRIWMASTAMVFLLGFLWTLATPLGAAPDEPTQIVKAAAVVRGELVGTSTTARPTAYVEVRVPSSFATDGDLATCYAGRDTVPAGCAPQLSDRSTVVKTATYVGRNPPLYYLLVGAPTLLWHSNFAVYVMRLLSVAWSALLLGLALAVATVASRSRLLVVAVAVVVTPMVVFLTAVVNPSGLEIAAAVCTWTSGLVLLEHRRHPPPELVASCGAAAAVLVLCQGLDPLWLAIIGLTLVALSPRVITDLWRDRLARRWAGVVAVCGVLAVAFIVGAHTLVVAPVGKPVLPHASTIGIVGEALGRTGTLLRQSVGVFGWLDTPSPVAVLVGWWMAVAVVVVLGIVTGRRYHASVLATLLVAAVAIPTALMVSQARHDGLVWQTRDGMALYVGIPLVAAFVASRARDVPVRDVPVRDVPVRDGPVRDGPARDGPVRDGPVRDVPVRDGPVRDGPVRDGPVRDGPTTRSRAPRAQATDIAATVATPTSRLASGLRFSTVASWTTGDRTSGDRVEPVGLEPTGSATDALDGLGHRALGRLTILITVGVAIGQFVDFAWALRRYTVGLGGTMNPLATVAGGWSPPLPTLVLLVTAALAAIVYGWWLHQLAAVAEPPVTAASRSKERGQAREPRTLG